MKKNVAAQTVGAQLISKTDGSAVTTGTTSVYYTGDNGVQSINSPGVATHKGNGYWEYSPDQSETNFDHVAFTFVNSSAVNASIQIWTSFPQTGDNFPRIGAPVGASISADVAATKALLPTALATDGSMKASVQSFLGTAFTEGAGGRIAAAFKQFFNIASPAATMDHGVLVDTVTTATTATNLTNAPTAGDFTATMKTSITTAATAATPVAASVTGNVGGNVVGSVASVTARVTANTDQLAGQTVTAAAGVTFPTSVASPTNITAGTITTVTNLTNAPTSGDLTATMKTSVTTAATAATPTAAAVTGSVGSVVGLTASDVGAIKTVTDKLGDTFEADSSPANFRFTAHALANAPVTAAAPSAASVATAVRTELAPELASVTRIETVTDKVGDMVEADSSPASYRYTAHALANAPSGGGTAPTVTQIADEVQTRTIAAVTTVGAVTGNVGGNVVGSIGSLATQAKADVNAEADTALSDVGVTGTVTGRIDAAISTRLATSGYTAPLDAAGTRTAVGLATASLDTQLALSAGTRVIEGAYTHDQLLRLISAVQLGKTTIGQNSPSGAVVTFRDVNDTVDRAVYEVSSNPAERLSSTLTP